MEISIPNETRFQLDGALLFYHQHSEYSVSGSHVAAILHKVGQDGKLEPGRALDRKALEYFFHNSNGVDKFKFQESKVLARSYSGIIWFEKSRRAPIYFETPEKERQKLNKFSGLEIIWPPLLFMINNDSLYCRALKSNRRPTPKTVLYVAPLTHIEENGGHVCLPDGIRINRQESLEKNMAMVSEFFYMGKFGHRTGTMKQINHPGGHDGFWIEYLKKRKHDRFPVELLKATNQKLEDLLK